MYTINLPADQILTVTPDALSTGKLVRLSDLPGGEPFAPVALSASTAVSVGPFATPRRYRVDMSQGSFTYTISDVAEVEVSSMASQSSANVAITGGSMSGVAIRSPVTEYDEDGAIAVSPHVAVLTKATAGAYTLAAPTANDEGIELTITSKTEAAHVVTATGLLEDGVTGGAKDEATFAAFLGATITLVAVGLVWHVKSLNAVTVAAAA